MPEDNSVTIVHEGGEPEPEKVEEPVEGHPEETAESNKSESVSLATENAPPEVESPKAPEPIPPKSNVQSAREHLLNALEALDNELEV